MKKIITILLAALMIVALVPTSVFADVSIEEYMDKHIMNFWESNVYIQTAEEVNLRNMPCSEKTNSNSKILVVLPKNSCLLTTGIFQNDQRNLWYRVLYNGHTYYAYINSTNFPAHRIIRENEGSLTVENLQFPEEIVRGEEFSISGIVKNPYASLDWIHTGLTDSEGNVIHGHSADIRALNGIYEYNFSGSSFERQLSSLNELEPGDYSLNIYVSYKYNYVHSEDNIQEIRPGVSSDIVYRNKFTVVDPHTCIFRPGSIRSSKHPHNYIGECPVCGEKKEIEGTGSFKTTEVVVMEPTCTSEGIKEIVCAYGVGKVKCGAIIKRGKIEMLDHTPVTTPKGIVCEVCSAFLGKEINDLHKHIYLPTNEVEEAHPHRSLKKCPCGKIEYLKTENYELETKVTESTCTVYGKTEMVCNVCGEVESSIPIALADHTIQIINRTETYSGDQFCTVCEQVIRTGIEIMPGTAHGCTFVLTTEKESAHPHRSIFRCECGDVMYGAENVTPIPDLTPSTCVQEGKIVYNCQICRVELSSEVLALADHTISIVDQSETYTGDKVCTVCEQIIEKGQDIPQEPEHTCNFESTGKYEEAHPHREILQCGCGETRLGDESFTTSILNKTETYTGDECCDSCGEVIKKGQNISTGILLGDVNGDGTVDAKDATQILRYANGKSSSLNQMSEAEQLASADVNGDKTVDAKDATQILRHVNGKPSALS